MKIKISSFAQGDDPGDVLGVFDMEAVPRVGEMVFFEKGAFTVLNVTHIVDAAEKDIPSVWLIVRGDFRVGPGFEAEGKSSEVVLPPLPDGF